MANNVSVAIVANAAGLRAELSAAQADVKAFTKELNSLQAQARGGAGGAELAASLSVVATKAEQAEASVAVYKQQLAAARAAAVENAVAAQAMAVSEGEVVAATEAGTAAVVASTAAHTSNRAITEGLVLVHEALSGRFHRLAGSAIIEAQALAGAERTSAALAAVMSPLGVAIGAGVAMFGLAALAAVQYAQAQEKLTATSVGLGAISGLTAQQIDDAAQAASQSTGQTIGATRASAEAFAEAGVKSEAAIATLSSMVSIYATLTGQKAAEAQKQLAEAMQDPVRGAEELNGKLGILNSSQMEQIRTLTAAGEKDKAVAILTQALAARMNEAHTAGVGLAGAFDNLGEKAENAALEVIGLTKAVRDYNAAAYQMADAALHPGRAGAVAAAQRQAQLNQASAAGYDAYKATPEGEYDARRDELGGRLTEARKALAADQSLGNAAGVKRDTAAITDYTHALQTLIPVAQKAHEIAQLDAKIADARHAHNKAQIADLTKQRELLETGGEVMSAADAQQKAADAANVASERGAGHAKAGPDVVQQWREQLQKQEEDSNDFFADNTAKEQAFWQSKLAITKSGSKDWLAVQHEIYQTASRLAHQAYEKDMRALGAKAQADKDNWSKYRADLQAELDRIKGTPVKPGPGVNSQEYQDQLTKIADAEREHNEKMIAMQDEVAQHAVKSLSDSLDAQMSILKTRAETAKALNDEKGKSSITGPFGDVSASQKNMAIDRQTAEQELALEQQKMAAQLAADQSVIDAKAKLYDGDVERYRDALQKKADDEQQFQNKIRVMQVQMAAQQTQATLKIQQAWSSAITPMVDSFGNGIKGMIEGTENLHTALRGIADTILGVVITSIERWVAAQIVAAIMGQAAGVTSTKSQVAAAAGLAGANGVASMAAAPFPLDLGAPAFGAAMSMAALAFGAFDQGMDVVPDDMVAQIHAGERIVPAADNSAIISALSGGGGGGSGPAFNYSPTINSPHTTWGDLLRNHGSEMKGWVRNQMRNGKLR